MQESDIEIHRKSIKTDFGLMLRHVWCKIRVHCEGAERSKGGIKGVDIKALEYRKPSASW